MKIDLSFTHIPVTDDKLKNHLVAVVDVLRASSTICEALRNGAKEIIPLAEVSEAMELTGKLSRDNVLLCGEREGNIIPGYDLGNSPLEYSREMVQGKTLIFTSTNGSVAMTKAASAKSAIIVSFNNISAAVDYILRAGEDLTIICSGNNMQFAMEDAVCGGMMVNMLCQQSEDAVELNDGAQAAVILFQKFRSKYRQLLVRCFHGRYLKSLGYDQDLEFCSQVDNNNAIPVLKEGKIILNTE